MTQTQEAEYQKVVSLLKQSKTAMQVFMSMSLDWTTKIMVEAEFDELLQSCKEFARCQYGRNAKWLSKSKQ